MKNPRAIKPLTVTQFLNKNLRPFYIMSLYPDLHDQSRVPDAFHRSFLCFAASCRSRTEEKFINGIIVIGSAINEAAYGNCKHGYGQSTLVVKRPSEWKPFDRANKRREKVKVQAVAGSAGKIPEGEMNLWRARSYSIARNGERFFAIFARNLLNPFPLTETNRADDLGREFFLLSSWQPWDNCLSSQAKGEKFPAVLRSKLSSESCEWLFRNRRHCSINYCNCFRRGGIIV